MNRSLLFSNNDWIVSRLLFHNYYLLIWLSIIVRKGIDTNFNFIKVVFSPPPKVIDEQKMR